MICDVCSAPGDGRKVAAADFRREVAAGRFDPFRLGLVRAPFRTDGSDPREVWFEMVRRNDTPWSLCDGCHDAFRASRKDEVGPPSPGAAPAALEELRRLHPPPPPPPVPADWKPGLFKGFFGKPKPWAGIDDALGLFRHGRIPEGRELLRRHVESFGDPRAKLLLAFDLLRPPHDPSIKREPLVTTLSSPDRPSLETLTAFTMTDGAWMAEAFLASSGRPAGSADGAFVQLCASLAAGGLWLQTQILHPRGKETASLVVTKLVKGFALFLERRHDEAWGLARATAGEPEATVGVYEQSLGVKTSPEEGRRLADCIRTHALILLGLIAGDLGFEAERREAFRAVGGSLHPALAEACRLLS